MISRRLHWWLLFAIVLAISILVAADEMEPEAAVYSDNGADACLGCHGSAEVALIFGSVHGSRIDERGPFAQHQCESCHGALGDKLPLHGDAAIGFGADSKTPVEQQNAVCLSCHQETGAHWNNSSHAAEDLGCADCHSVHAKRDAMFSMNEQPAACYSCHLKARGQFAKPHVHPVRAQKMNCSTCHASHGSSTDFDLNRATLNETCYDCHAEKRGPFVFEHPPATEDCSLCHQAHGSTHPAMLTKTPHLLCQQCHSQRGHPSLRLTSAGLPDDAPSAFVLAGQCMNCHSAVHGSNHPSGITLTR